MRIDQTHRSWITLSAVLLAAATVGYVIYALAAQTGPDGGSFMGLTYGIAGYAMMLFAGLLGARKKVPVWRIGRTQTWMRGHIWFGLLSLPFILFHAGFVWKGPLTYTLMIFFFIVWVSGILGALIQHYVPQLLMSRVQMETIYEEIPHVREQLREEADTLEAYICGPVGMPEAKPVSVGSGLAVRQAPEVSTTILAVEPEDKARFQEIYASVIRPFLQNPEAPNDLAEGVKANAVFEGIYRTLPVEVHPVVEDLENICEEERQLNLQRKYYHVLHGWLIVHVPLSIALLVLGGIHAVVALTY
jgi:hypothetical protein